MFYRFVFRGAVSVPEKAYFGEGSGVIQLDNVDCQGDEENLAQCGHNGYVREVHKNKL